MKDKLAFLIAFVLVFVSFTPTISMAIKILLSFFCIIFVLCYEIKFKRKDFYLIISFVIFILVSTSFDFLHFSLSAVSYTNLYFIFCIFLGWLCAKSILSKSIIYYSERIIFYSALVSMFLGLLVFLNEDIVRYFFDYSYYHTSHKTLYIMNFLIVDGLLVPRNAGFASEPGVFQYLLNAGFAIYIYFSKDKFYDKKFYITIALYFICIISTNSISGVFCFISIVLFYFFSAKPLYKLLIFIIALMISPFIIDVVVYHLSVKLDFGGDSFVSRAAPAFNIFTQHLTWLGKGTTYYDIYNESLLIGSYDTYSQISLRFGLIGLFLYMLMLLNRLRDNFIIFLIIMVTSFGQAVWFFPFTILLLYSRLSAASNKHFVE